MHIFCKNQGLKEGSFQIHIPGNDSNPEKEPFLGESTQDCKAHGYMNLVTVEALRLLAHIVEMKELMETAPWDIKCVLVQVQAELQVLELTVVCYLAVDDGIYMFHQTCKVLSSHSRSTLFHPVATYQALSQLNCKLQAM